MVGIILQAIKLAPRLFFQLLFQPSKWSDFKEVGRRKVYISIGAFLFVGILWGGVLAIPHYLIYNDFTHSIFFAVAVAVAGAGAVAVASVYVGEAEFVVAFPVAFVFAFTLAVAGAFAFAVADGFTVAFAFAGVVAGGFAFAIVGAFAGAFAGEGAFISAGADAFAGARAAGTADGLVVVGAFAFITLTALGIYLLPPAGIPIFLFLSVICWTILYLSLIKKIHISNGIEALLFIPALVLMVGAGGGAIPLIELPGMIIYPFGFFLGYLFISQIQFIDQNKKFKENFKENKVETQDVSHQKFGTVQVSSLIWGPLIAIILCIPIYFNWAPKLNTKIIIAALMFAVMPVFILHIPDYLLCLPMWLFQRRKVSKSHKNNREPVRLYEKSLLFKHEMIFFQLPGLYKIMVSFAGNNEIGIEETVKRINHLYSFTFQQKQAQKAVVGLGKNRETAHPFILFLLEEKNFPLFNTLSETNRLAELYQMLFEKIEQTPPEKESIYSRILTFGKYYSTETSSKKKREFIPETLEEKLKWVCSEMEKEEGHRFNNEMTETLEAAHKFLTAKSLKDFFEAEAFLEIKLVFPGEIKYFSAIENMVPPLKKIKYTLLKVETIERTETKRSILNDQKQNFETLTKTAEENLFEPFKNIWKSSLTNCSKLIDREIELLQDSADLVIGLKNTEILASEEERMLYFGIRNKGQELATDVSITLQVENSGIAFPAGAGTEISVIESGTVKEISFPITARFPLKTTIEGTLTFSDRTMEGKKVPFSFPVTILERSVEFEELKNPYIVGQPLKGDTSIFFGRKDAFDFIDKNIMASGDFHSIVCHGLRRTGKSSLLYRIENKGFSDKRLVPINVDMQGIDDEKDFYHTLSNTIKEKFSLHSVSSVENFNQFKQFLKEIKPELGERIIVLMVDEFEELQMRVEEKKISKTIFSNIRHLMQHEEKLTFLFCGTHKLEEMSADYWSIFFNTALYYRISHLKPKDTIRLIKEPVKGQLTYDDLAVEQIIKMSCGQPYLTQLICRTIVNDLNENKKRNDAVINDVDDAVEQIISEGIDHFSRHIWDESNLLERLILSAAAEELTHKQLDHIGVDAIFEKIKPLIPNFSRKASMETLEKLVSKEILGEKNMLYYFPVNLLRKWIAARYPLRKVREEI